MKNLPASTIASADRIPTKTKNQHILKFPAADIGDFFKESLSAWVDDRASSMGAALAYYTLFSIAPLLMIVIAVAGAVFGEEAALGAIYSQLASILGSDGALAVQGLIQTVQENKQSGWGAVLGVALLVLGATTVVAELQSALDVIWRAPQVVQRAGWLRWLQSRFLSLSLVLGMGFLLMVSLVLSAAVAAWGVVVGTFILQPRYFLARSEFYSELGVICGDVRDDLQTDAERPSCLPRRLGWRRPDFSPVWNRQIADRHLYRDKRRSQRVRGCQFTG